MRFFRIYWTSQLSPYVSAEEILQAGPDGLRPHIHHTDITPDEAKALLYMAELRAAGHTDVYAVAIFR